MSIESKRGFTARLAGLWSSAPADHDPESQTPLVGPEGVMLVERLMMLIIGLFLIIWWLLAIYIERHKAPGTLAMWQAQFGVGAGWSTLEPTITWLLRAFSWRVLRHFIPLIVGWWLAYDTVVQLLQILYSITHRGEAQAFLGNLMRPAGAGSGHTLGRDTFAAERESQLLLRVGGPGRLTLKNGDAAVTERNGCFYRVLGPGRHQLKRFEYVKSVVDLRQKEYSQKQVELMTQDGIRMEADITVIYRICTDDTSCPESSSVSDLPTVANPTQPTRTTPYPFGPDAVRRAVYCEMVEVITPRPDPDSNLLPQEERKIITWELLAPRVATKVLRDTVASLQLSDIIYPLNPEAEPYYALQEKLERETRAEMRRYGVAIITIRIDGLRLPDPVTGQLVETWWVPQEIGRYPAIGSGLYSTVEREPMQTITAQAIWVQQLMQAVQAAPVTEGMLLYETRRVTLTHVLDHLEATATTLADDTPLRQTILPQIQRLRQALATEQY